MTEPLTKLLETTKSPHGKDSRWMDDWIGGVVER